MPTRKDPKKPLRTGGAYEIMKRAINGALFWETHHFRT